MLCPIFYIYIVVWF